MKQKRKSDVAVLLDYAGSHKRLPASAYKAI